MLYLLRSALICVDDSDLSCKTVEAEQQVNKRGILLCENCACNLIFVRDSFSFMRQAMRKRESLTNVYGEDQITKRTKREDF